jgi:group I intron endonuclease
MSNREPLTAFLGYEHSPKWFKYNNIKNFNKVSLNHLKQLSRSKFSVLNSIHGGYTFHSQLNYNFKRPYTSSANSPLLPVKETDTISKFMQEKNLDPKYSYDNLHLETTKNLIKKESKDLSGIYLILNKVTLDYYIGSASTNRFYVRFYNHLINLSGSKIVKLAVRKYKLRNFAFYILELFPEIITKENNKQLLDLEDFYLKSLLPNYNILTEAGSSFGYKHTEIDRIKMKSNYSLERRLRIGNLNKGKFLSEETKEKIRQKALNRCKLTYYEEALLNMKKNSKTLILYNLDNTVFGEYNSITEASKAINCSLKTIFRALRTDKKILKRR